MSMPVTGQENKKPLQCSRYEHILLPTDLTSDETYLRHRAMDLADHYGARLTAVHVVQDVPAFIDMYGYFNATDLGRKMQAAAQEAINTLGEDLKINQEDLIVVHGNPKEKIVCVAHDLNCDLIIIGAHSKKGIAKLLGATAAGVMQTANCDVFVIKCPNNSDE